MAVGGGEEGFFWGGGGFVGCKFCPLPTIQTSLKFGDFSFNKALSNWKGLLRDEDRDTKCRQITFLSPNKMLRIKRNLFPRLVVTEVTQEP